MTAYQTAERGASEVNFLFFIKLSPESLGHIYRPSGSVPSLATPQPKLPSESIPHPLLCLHFIGCQGKHRKNVCLAPSLIGVPAVPAAQGGVCWGQNRAASCDRVCVDTLTSVDITSVHLSATGCHGEQLNPRRENDLRRATNIVFGDRREGTGGMEETMGGMMTLSK